MFCPVTSRARRCDQRAVVAALSPENVLTWPPRWRSSLAFAGLLCSLVNSQARSQCAVQGDGAVRAVVGAATGVAVGAGRGGARREQGVPDRGQTALDE